MLQAYNLLSRMVKALDDATLPDDRVLPNVFFDHDLLEGWLNHAREWLKEHHELEKSATIDTQVD